MITENIIHEDDTRTSEEIEADIRETRDRMDATLDELGNRLTPRSLLNSAFDWWETPDAGNPGSDAARKAVIALARQARSHPIPAILIGSGVAWLVSESMERGHDADEIGVAHVRGRIPSRTDSIESAATGKVQHAKDVATDAIDSAKGKAAEIGDKIHETTDRLSAQAHEAVERGKSSAIRLKDEVKHGYEVGTQKLSETSEEYPLALGIGFLALGALSGLIIPRTRREDELMGERSDQLAQETKHMAEDLMETGKSVGTRVLETVKEEARAQGLTGESLAEKIGEIADKSGQVAQKAKEEFSHAAEEEGLKSGITPRTEIPAGASNI